jgi:hypothetical protein
MTISEVLEELRWVDRDVHETLRNYPIYCSVGEALTVNLLDSSNQILVEDAIQGSIQRACERRGWEIDQNYRTRGRDGDLPQNMRHYAVVTSWDNDVHTYRGMGNSPAEALPMAYIAAVRGEAKR